MARLEVGGGAGLSASTVKPALVACGHKARTSAFGALQSLVVAAPLIVRPPFSPSTPLASSGVGLRP